LQALQFLLQANLDYRIADFKILKRTNQSAKRKDYKHFSRSKFTRSKPARFQCAFSLSLSLSLPPALATVVGVHHNQISQGPNRTTTISTMVLQPIPEFENSLSLQFIIQEEKERDLKLPTTTTITTQSHTFFQKTSSTRNCLKIVVHDHSKRQGAFYYIYVCFCFVVFSK
jgi:hypothetical protein